MRGRLILIACEAQDSRERERERERSRANVTHRVRKRRRWRAPTSRRYFRQRHRICPSRYRCIRSARNGGSSLNVGLTGCKIHRFLPEFQASVVKLAQLLELAHHVTALVRH